VSEAGRHRWSRRVVFLVTTAVVAAGAVVVVAVALAGSGTSTPAGERGGGPRGVTERAVARLLAAEPTPPGATRVNAAPVAALASPVSEPASGNLVRRTAWWLVPGGVDRVLAYVAAHRPAGVIASGSEDTGGGGGPTVQGLSFDATGPQWRQPSIYADFQLAVVATADGNRTALRVDAEATWLPARSASSRIPDPVTTVDVVERRGGGAITVRRTLPAAAARRLAVLVNALPVQVPGSYNCPMDDGRTDALTFHAPGRSITVTVRVTGCGEVSVGRAGPGHPILLGGRDLHSAVARELAHWR